MDLFGEMAANSFETVLTMAKTVFSAIKLINSELKMKLFGTLCIFKSNLW